MAAQNADRSAELEQAITGLMSSPSVAARFGPQLIGLREAAKRSTSVQRPSDAQIDRLQLALTRISGLLETRRAAAEMALKQIDDYQARIKEITDGIAAAQERRKKEQSAAQAAARRTKQGEG